MVVNTSYIGLGSNLGDRKDFIDKALKFLAETKQVELVQTSDIIETKPLGRTDQPDYLNMVAEIKTTLTPEELYKILSNIENNLGRERKEKWLSRTIDLDLLLFGDQVIKTPELIVPHSQMHLRYFVLQGLCQLNPDLIHPVMKVSVSELASRLNGGNFILEQHKPQLISIAGNIGVGKTTLAKKLSERFICDVLYEPYDDNPFMPDVYAGRKDLALDSQLFFLTRRAEQLNLNSLVPGQIYISDYVFDKEIIYAKTLLNKKQLDLYEKIYQPFIKNVFEPVLVIHIKDSGQNCLERIHNRNRPYEQQIELNFLNELGCEYDKLFSDWKKSPVFRITTQRLDYTNDAAIENLISQIKCYLALNYNGSC